MIFKDAVSIINGSEYVILSTIGADGFPESRAMLNLKDKHQGLTLFFTSNTSSRKVSQIKENSKASAYFCINREWTGLMLSGRIEIVSDPKEKRDIWTDGWEVYYPKGADDPDYTVLKLTPDKCFLYRNMERTAFDI
jgi:general stress protein 26